MVFLAAWCGFVCFQPNWCIASTCQPCCLRLVDSTWMPDLTCFHLHIHMPQPWDQGCSLSLETWVWCSRSQKHKLIQGQSACLLTLQHKRRSALKGGLVLILRLSDRLQQNVELHLISSKNVKTGMGKKKSQILNLSTLNWCFHMINVSHYHDQWRSMLVDNHWQMEGWHWHIYVTTCLHLHFVSTHINMLRQTCMQSVIHWFIVSCLSSGDWSFESHWQRWAASLL